MFYKASCVGRLCPPSLEEINISGYVDRVILVPYILTEKGYYVQTFKGEFLKSECGSKSPFICGEEALEKHKIESRNITHIHFIGHAKAEEMIIFIKLDKKTGNGFVKVTPTMNLEYSWQIKYVLGSEMERFTLKGKDVATHHILTRLEGDDLINFCKTSHLQQECNKYITLLIENKMGKDFLKDKSEYVGLYDLYSILYSGNFKFDESLGEAAKRNELFILNFLFPNVHKGERAKIVVLGAIKGNHLDLIQLFIRKGFKDFEFGAKISAIEGNKDLVDFFLERIKEPRNLKGIFNVGMVKAAHRGDKYLVDFFIKKGADNWYEGMKEAAIEGHKDLVDLFLERIEDLRNVRWMLDLGMSNAAYKGDKDLVNYFISKKADYWDLGMKEAAKGGHKNLVVFFIEKGADDWNSGLEHASEGGHKDLVEFFISKGADDFETGLERAIEGGHTNLVKFFVEEKGVNDFENGLQLSASACNKELAYYFVGKGAHNWNSALGNTSEINCKELYDFFTQKIAERDAMQDFPRDPRDLQEERILPRMGWLE
jgi:hypothetical protein